MISFNHFAKAFLLEQQQYDSQTKFCKGGTMALKTYLTPLTFEKIKEVIQDMEHVKSGVKFHFAIDPYELVDFCFPGSSLKKTPKFPDQNYKQITHDQIALYHVFFGISSKPILLKDYKSEIQGILEYIGSTISNAFKVAKILQGNLFKDNNINLFTTVKTDADINILKKNFSLILAIAMDRFSEGIDRFKRIYDERLTIDILDLGAKTQTEKDLINQIYKSYKHTDLVDKVLRKTVDAIIKDLEEKSQKINLQNERKISEGNHNLTQSLEIGLDKIIENTFTDTLVLDHIIYLNKELENAYKQKMLSDRHIILYLSAAPKTKKFFELDEVKEKMPKIDDKSIQIWRTRDQVFAYVANRDPNRDKVIANLERVSDSLDKIKAFDDNFKRCSKCALDGQHPKKDCLQRRVCNEIKAQIESISTTRLQAYNLGLIANFQEYAQIVNELKKKKETDFIAYFKELYSNNENLSHEALEKKEHLQWLIISKLQFTNMLPEQFQIEQQRQQTELTSNDTSSIVPIDVMSGIPYVPSLSKVKSGYYENISQAIYNSYRFPQKVECFFEALEAFLKQDSIINEVHVEHEFFRALLYLIIPVLEEHRLGRNEGISKEGFEGYYKKCYQFSLVHVQYMLNKWNKFSIDREDEKIKQKYCYLACWSNRLLKNYIISNELSLEYINTWPENPDFYHNISLNTYFWFKEDPICPYSLQDAIEYANKAIKLFNNQYYISQRKEYLELMRTSYNNIAYMHAEIASEYNEKYDDNFPIILDFWDSALKNAYKALNSLHELNKDESSTIRAEYLHTEAYLEFQKYFFYKVTKKDKPLLREILSKALDIAQSASKKIPKISYRQLIDDIAKALASLEQKERN